VNPARGLPSARRRVAPLIRARTASRSPPLPKRTGSSAGSPVSSATAAIAARASSSLAISAVLTAMHTTFAGRRGKEIRSWSSTSSASGGIGCPGQPSISVAPARWQRTNECGAAPCTSPRVTPEYMGWISEPWPSTKRSFPPRSPPSTTSRSAAPARKSAMTASTAIPQPAIAIPVWPVGTKTDSSPRRRASRSSSTATVFLPIAQSEPTVRTIFASTSRFAPVGTLSPSGGRRRSRSSTPCSRASSESSGSREMNSWRPLSTSSPFAMQLFRSSRHAGGKRPPWVATPTTATVGSKRSASPTLPTTGMPSWDSPARFESRIATTGSGP
jgi:hypothetical protein